MYIYLFFIIILFILVLITLYFIYNPYIPIKASKIGPFSLLFIDYKGDFSKIKPLQTAFLSNITKTFQPKGTFTLYYDNPRMVIKKAETRAIYGVILHEKEPLQRIKAFCRKYEDIRYKSLQEIPCILTPFLNKLSFMDKSFQLKILPSLVKALLRLNKGEKEIINFIGVIEISDIIKGNTIYGIPYGAETNDYYLTGFPEPKAL